MPIWFAAKRWLAESASSNLATKIPTSERVVSEGTGIPLVPTFPRNPSTHFLPAYPHIYTQQAVITHPADPIQNQPPRNMEHKDASVTKGDTEYWNTDRSAPLCADRHRPCGWAMSICVPTGNNVNYTSRVNKNTEVKSFELFKHPIKKKNLSCYY